MSRVKKRDLPKLNSVNIIRKKLLEMHLVLTGRDAHYQLVELADTVSEVIEVKHAYQKDIEPQPGINY